MGVYVYFICIDMFNSLRFLLMNEDFRTDLAAVATSIIAAALLMGLFNLFS